MPWRLRIAGSFLRGFIRNPTLAMRLASKITVDMKSLYRFNLHIHGKDFLRDLYEESDKLGLRPFLMWGTLLGCIREGGFIAHDYDLDLGMHPDDYAKKDILIEAMKKRGYLVRMDVPYLFSFNRPDGLLHLDISLVYLFKGKILTSEFIEETGEMSANTFPENAFRELKRTLFLKNISVWLPSDTESILESMYGNWRVPVKDYNYRTGPKNEIYDLRELREIKEASLSVYLPDNI